jgi:hypothetical protein
LKEWLRYVEDLGDEEEMVHVCEPETGKNLSDDEEKRLLEDHVNYQEGRNESLDFHMGNEMVSLDDLRGFQVSNKELSSFQVGNEMRSLEDLIDCQVGSRKFPIF